MIPLETAIVIMNEKIGQRRVPVETIPIREAAGRFLAADLFSKVDLPPFDKSAMDGFAVMAGDLRGEYRLKGIISAGDPGTGPLEPGTTFKVMTGAPVPPGTDKVVMVEQAVEKNGKVRFENPSPVSNICKRAEDVAVGDKILEAGNRIGVLEIANSIGCGISQVDVARQISIAILATGDELVDSYSELSPGKILNTNSPLICELARRHGLEVTGEEIVPDDPSKLRAVLQRSLAGAHIVVLSGGVSVGDFDFVPRAITECGLEIHFSRLAVKPGKPLTFATGDSSILFGLPGNPVSVYLMFHLFVLRAAALLSGGTYEPKRVKLCIAADYKQRSIERTAYVPCRISAGGFVEPVEYHGSAHLAALIQTDGFFIVPKGVETLKAKTEVSVIQFKEGCC